MFTKFINDLQQNARNPKFNFPWIRILICILVFFGVSFFVPIPYISQPSGASGKIDNTIWVGVLSFEGAYGIAIVAAASWFAEATLTMYPLLFSGAMHAGIFQSQSGLDAESFKELLQQKINEDKSNSAIMAAHYVISGLIILLVVIVALPLAIWLPGQWEAGLLVASVFWILGPLYNLIFMIGGLLFLQTLWSIYGVFKELHERQKHLCDICARNEANVIQTNEVAATNEDTIQTNGELELQTKEGGISVEKEIVVVVLQEEGSYHSFKMNCNRVPKKGEYLTKRNLVYQVENVMTFLKGNGYPVVLVKKVDTVGDMKRIDMERLLNDLDLIIR